MSQEKRIIWVDVVKYICIIMVMLSHLEAKTEVWEVFYTPFFLTLFFFASGYVYKNQNNFKEFIYKKIRQLFIPWLIFSVLNILLSQLLSFNEHGNLLSELGWNFLQIRGQGDGIWFVAALFVAFIPFYFFIKWYENSDSKIFKNKKALLAIVFAFVLSLFSIIYTKFMPDNILPWGSSALPWHIEYIFQAMFYMVLGYIFKKQFEKYLDKYNNHLIRISSIIIYLLLVYIPFFARYTMPIIVDIFYNYISSLVGIFSIVMFAKIVPSIRYVNYVGQNTLIYFALHGKTYSLIQSFLKKFAGNFYSSILGNAALSSIFALFFALLLSVILIVPAYIINRWLPFIVGRKYQKEKIEVISSEF